MVSSPLIQRRMQIFFVDFPQTDSLLQKLPRPKINLESKLQDFILHNVEVTSVEKILKNLDVAKASGIVQVSAKFFKDGPPVMLFI